MNRENCERRESLETALAASRGLVKDLTTALERRNDEAHDVATRYEAEIKSLALRLEAESNRAERYEEALYRIAQWALAYPPDIFLEPDLKRAHEVLKAAGMGLDGISAHAMRHALKGVGRIATDVLPDASVVSD